MAEKQTKPGWQTWRFEQMATNIADRAEPTPDDSALYVGLEHLDSDSLRVRRWGSKTDLIGTKFKMSKGDILFARRNAYLKRVAIAPHDGLFSAHGMMLRAKPDVVLPDFLPYFMQSDLFMNRAMEISVGSLSPTINWKTMAVQEFALPPMKEQKRLVEVLGPIAELEEDLRNAEHEADRLQKAAMQDLLDAHLNGWPERPIGEVFKVTTGGTPSRNNVTFWNGDVPWVKTGEVNYHVIESTEERITDEGLKGSAAKLCPPNSVLVALYGQGPTRGRVGMLGIAATVNQACAAIYPTDDFDPWFVYYYLSGKYLSLRAMAQGAAQPNLNLAMIKGFGIPVPTLEQQKTAVASIDAVAKAKAEILQRREKAAELKRKVREGAIGNVVH